MTSVPIYRYKFTQEFMDNLHNFSKVHQYDHRKDFKEAWSLWTKDNEDMVNQEVQRLTDLRYDGDILDKMFKSARYYYRKKSDTKPEPKERKEYTSLHKDVLDSMDSHISENINLTWFSPAAGFDHYCQEHVTVLKNEINRIQITDHIELFQKFKKTYKNRYFIVKNK